VDHLYVAAESTPRPRLLLAIEESHRQKAASREEGSADTKATSKPHAVRASLPKPEGQEERLAPVKVAGEERLARPAGVFSRRGCAGAPGSITPRR